MFRPGPLTVVLAFVFMAPFARAWGPLGHMLTMKIASGELTPKARERLDAAIIRFNAKEKPDAPYDAVTAACWMDDVRARTKDFNEWHYVTLPSTHEGLPLPEGTRQAPDVVWAIGQCEAIAEGGGEEPGIDRDQSLVMLLHLVGDIHQPLHTTGRSDYGGNQVRLSNLKDVEADLIFSKGGNLHFFWDSAYRREFRNGEVAVSCAAPLHPRLSPVTGHREARKLVDREAPELRKKYPPEAFGDVLGGDASAWARESHALGFDLAYGKLPAGSPVRLDREYVGASRVCAEKRIALAGYRLAALLNRLLDPVEN
ncbi:MAG: S1/P1 nuclease [Terrimicrobiaceae bacterium]